VGGVLLELAVSDVLAADVARRGLRVARAAPLSTEFGAAQLIYRLEDGYVAASEPRRDGQAVGF
jgi:gamma-glutamyltranspeptidase/glutathione hydrolase